MNFYIFFTTTIITFYTELFLDISVFYTENLKIWKILLHPASSSISVSSSYTAHISICRWSFQPTRQTSIKRTCATWWRSITRRSLLRLCGSCMTFIVVISWPSGLRYRTILKLAVDEGMGVSYLYFGRDYQGYLSQLPLSLLRKDRQCSDSVKVVYSQNQAVGIH